MASSHWRGWRCCDPTWKVTPAATSPSRPDRPSRPAAISISQPNLRDSGHSAPSFDVRMRQTTSEPGAFSAIFSSSPMLSKAYMRTPRS